MLGTHFSHAGRVPGAAHPLIPTVLRYSNAVAERSAQNSLTRVVQRLCVCKGVFPDPKQIGMSYNPLVKQESKVRQSKTHILSDPGDCCRGAGSVTFLNQQDKPEHGV